MTESVDDLIIEYLSYRGFKEGKVPLNGADPGKRIGKRIWRDEGLDVGSFLGPGPDPGSEGVLRIEVRKLSMGFFRGKKDRNIAIGLKDASAVVEAAGKGDKVVGIVRTSRLLLPPFSSIVAADLMSAARLIRVRAEAQAQPAPFEPKARSRKHDIGGSSGEDLSIQLDRKASKADEMVIAGGRRIGTLGSLIQGILEIGDDDLAPLLEEGRLSEFARRGLSSPALEAILTEVGRSGQGVEAPSVARDRFMLWVFESPVGPSVVSEIVEPMVKRLLNCNPHEAGRLSDMLSPLMDERSAPVLVDILFKVPAPNRPAVIRLLGRTGSRTAIGPLTKLRDLSSVESDRSEAVSALDTLGVRGDHKN
jgi:hypothetical protein